MLFCLQCITFLGVAYGSYIIFIDMLKLPTSGTEKAAQAYVKDKSFTMQLEIVVARLAARLAKYVKIDDYKRSKLEQELQSLNIDQTPEVYRATSIVTAGLVLLFVIPCMVIFPPASLVVIFIALVVYFKAENELKEQVKKKKEEIELELPRFCSTIKQELMATRDVLSILENYRKNAGTAMKKELDITCADMRTGSYESALLRFEGRVTSAALSDVIRGLLGTLRGDNNTSYFEILSHDMDTLEIQRLEAEAAKQPGKIKKYLFALLMCMIIMYIVILGVYAINSMSVF